MALRLRSLGFTCGVALAAVVGCGSDPEVGGGSGTAGSGGSDAGGSSGNTGGTLNVGNSGNTGGDGATAGTTPMGNCGAENCTLGQRCETNADDEQVCVDNECADLDCSATEECQPAPGGGNYCADISCEGDVDCPINRYCNGEICVDDACVGGSATCDGDQVVVCAQNGGSEVEAPYTCGSAGYYESTCDDTNPETAGCTCEDDWDCPEFTECEGGVCVGSGEEPTCTLPPTAFEDALPQLEFRWGGANEADVDADGSPFKWSSQVASTPMVINLNDDNGDGKVNEFDFPEILFMTYHDDNPNDEGVVRAVHGGGPDKGKDYFALCGTTEWYEGDALTDDCNPSGGDAESRTDALGASSGAIAAGDLDYDGFPEIVVPIEGRGIQILNNRGEVLDSATGVWPNGSRYPAPAIANVDHAGLAEIIVSKTVITLRKNGDSLEIADTFVGEYNDGTQAHNANKTEDHFGPVVCVADLTATYPGLEIVAGTSAYRLPVAPNGEAEQADCPIDDTSDFCQGILTKVWDVQTDHGTDEAAGGVSDSRREGFCAVADVLGTDTGAAPGPANPLDQVPEVVIIVDGHLLVLAADDGEVLRLEALGDAFDDHDDVDAGSSVGGPPNIDDFDGDGFPEIGTALFDFYRVIDLQEPDATNCQEWTSVLGKDEVPPGANVARAPGGACTEDADCNTGAVCNTRIGQCTCLHNGWMRDSEDDSSRATSSSVFDFNGDGAAEVTYNDECYFRVYDGRTGATYLALPSLSRTIIENTVVADVDNDGNAEIVFVTNNETIQCSEANLDSWPNGVDDVPNTTLPNGIEVWGDPNDVWVAARRIWNQNSYHVTNVTEGGAVPLHEPESWKPLNGRLYNTYRSQPRNYNVAPDLALTAIQISSPDVACGQLSDTIQIVVEVVNQGDLRVGPGVIMEFVGTWEDPALEETLEDSGGDPLQIELDKSLEPGASTLITVEYEKGSNGRDDFPVTITAFIDGDDTARECVENNNSIDGDVEPGAEVADLRVVVETTTTSCGSPEIDVTVYNDGSADAEDVRVFIYAGDPSQGGTLLGETTIAGPIGPGDSAEATIELDALSLDVTIYAVVDPMNSILECNDGNNVDEGPFLDCDPGVR